MVSFYKKFKRKISLKKGFIILRNNLSNHNRIKFYTQSVFEYNKVIEQDGEDKFLKKFISVLEDGYTVFDVGANMGLFTLYSRKAIETIHIYSFEPVREYYERLLENLKLNDINDIKTFNIGLGNTNKQSEFIYKRGL